MTDSRGIVYLIVDVEGTEMRLCAVNTLTECIRRLENRYQPLDLDESMAVFLEAAEIDDALGKLEEKLPRVIRRDRDELIYPATALRLVQSELRRVGKGWRQIGTVLRRYGDRRRNWSAEIKALRELKRRKRFEDALCRCTEENERCLKQSRKTLAGLLQHSDRQYVDHSPRGYYMARRLFALATTPASAARLSRYARDGLQINQLTYPTGGQGFFLDSAVRSEPDFCRVTLTVRADFRDLEGQLPSHIRAGAEDIYSQIGRLENVPDETRISFELDQLNFWKCLSEGGGEWEPQAVDGNCDVSMLPDITLKAVIELGPKDSDGRIVQAIAVPWYEVLRVFARDPEAIYQIPSRMWEEILAGAYKADGYEVVLTPRSGDHGRDIIATKRGVGSIRIVDQVKAYRPSNLVTADEVRSMLGVIACSNVSKGIVTTTSTFAPRLMEDENIARLIPYRLELRDRDRLLPWLRSLLRTGK